MEKENDKRLEEKLNSRFPSEDCIGEKIYCSMNDGKLYSGTLVRRYNSIILKDVEVSKEGRKLKYLALNYENMSAWWPEECITKDDSDYLE